MRPAKFGSTQPKKGKITTAVHTPPTSPKPGWESRSHDQCAALQQGAGRHNLTRGLRACDYAGGNQRDTDRARAQARQEKNAKQGKSNLKTKER